MLVGASWCWSVLLFIVVSVLLLVLVPFIGVAAVIGVTVAGY